MDFLRIMATALSGWSTENKRVAVAANNVANANTEGFVPSRVDGVERPEGGVDGVVRPSGTAVTGTDLAEEMVTLRIAENSAKADLIVMKTADRMTESLLDIKG